MRVLLPALERRGQRPTVLVGTSAGALNAASLAADADRDAEEAAARLIERWRGLRQGNVIQSLARRQALVTTVRYAGEVLGVPGVRLRGLLDPTPLRRSLDRLLDWPAVHRNLDDGPLDCLAVAASRAANPRAMVFIEGHGEASQRPARRSSTWTRRCRAAT